MIILKDISELVKSEYLKTVEKVTDNMIATTSHDMRTPLNTIIHMIMLVVSKVTDSNLLKWLKIASNSTNLLLFLVNDTLDFY
jgi:signal transduction histidine kinase